MFFARSFAMGANRYLDRQFDFENLRTRSRMIPSGLLPEKDSLFITGMMGILFVITAFFLNKEAGILSLPLLFILGFYSYMKRLSVFTHFYLGMCLGFVPLAIEVALHQPISFDFILLGLGIMFWVGGFDILYSMQDMMFDQKKRLKSIPALLGNEKSLWISIFSFALSLICFIGFGFYLRLALFYYLGLLVILAIFISLSLSVYRLIKKGEQNLEAVVFSLNSWVGVVFLVFLCLDKFF